MEDAFAVAQLLAGAIFMLLIAVSLWEGYRKSGMRKRPTFEKYTDPARRLEVVKNQRRLDVLGGELGPDLYIGFSARIRQAPKLERLRVICGPEIRVKRDAHERFCSKKGEKYERKDWWRAHPIFELAVAEPKKFQIFIKEKNRFRNERHFCVDDADEVAGVEEPHEGRESGGGTLYYNNALMGSFLRSTFERLLQAGLDTKSVVRWDKSKEVPFLTDFTTVGEQDG